MDKLPLTIVIPTRNEEINLKQCLQHAQIAEDIVVVDSGSTDHTISIAKSMGATVIPFRWSGGYPKKRNWVLQNYTFSTEWVLFLDADEFLTAEFVKSLRAALRRTDIVGWWLNYTNYFGKKKLKYGVPQRKLALIKLGFGFYERIDDQMWSNLDMEVHEHPILRGLVAQIREPIEHKDYRGIHHFISRHNEYSTWEARRWFELSKNTEHWPKLTKRQKIKYRNIYKWWFAPLYFIYTYFVRAGFLDGRTGFAYAILKYFYFFQIRQKIIELKQNNEENINT